MTPLEGIAAQVRGNKRWVTCIVAGIFILIILFSDRSEPGSVREHVSAWVGAHDYSPYARIDGFLPFKKSPECNLNSLQIYRPTKAICKERSTLMNAMSDGGRIGFDAPYQTRECDMRWYSTVEICALLSKFDAIHLVGDSMMRHLAQAMNMYLREDLPDGARATWKPGNPPNLDCHCHMLFDDHGCDRDGFAAVGTQSVWNNDPSSMKCPHGSIADIDFLPSVKDPPKEEELKEFKAGIRPARKEAFIFGQGGWDDFETDPAQRWISAFEGALADAIPEFVRPPPPTPKKDDAKASSGPIPESKDAAGAPGAITPRSADKDVEDWRHEFLAKLPARDVPPRLWISPNAQGLHKNPFFVLGQNNIKLMNFERAMRAWLEPRGFDTLGIFNLTVQSASLDGTHASMESNLVKAQMVWNWLDWVGGRESVP